MRVPIEMVPAPRHLWFSPDQCLAYYKKPYQIREIQIHWWDNPAKLPSHDGVVAYALRRTEGSVNYVVSANRITKMVEEENCAITSQGGNPFGIKLECSPYGTEQDYQTIAWLIAEIRKSRGPLPLVPHNKYWNTTCPGTIDLNKLDTLAKQIEQGGAVMSSTRRKLTPQECVDRFKNFAGRDDVKTTDPVCQNRYEDPESDEFLYGMLIHVRDLRVAEKTAKDKAVSQMTDLQKKLDEASSRPTQAAFDELKAKLQECQDVLTLPVDVNHETGSTETWLAKLLAAIFRKK